MASVRPARCDWPGVGSFALGYGATALDYLRKRTRDDPWFAAASGVMHAGRIGYNIQQRFAEKVTAAGPEAVIDIAGAVKTIGRAQDFARIVASFPVAAACYRRFCQQGSCVSQHGNLSNDGESLVECMRSAEYAFSDSDIEAAKTASSFNPAYPSLWDSMVAQKVITQRGGKWTRVGTGVGAKTRNLVAEYLGCDNAVAVDTHVANWLSATGRLVWIQQVERKRFDVRGRPIYAREPGGGCRKNKQGKCVQARDTLYLKTRFAKGPEIVEGMRADGYHVTDTMTDRQFAMMKREFQAMAAGCGAAPAVLQVGAWAQGTCDAVSAGRRYGAAVKGSIYLGEGKTDSCGNVPRFSPDLSDRGVRTVDLPKGAAERFTCKPGYFGNAAAAAPRGGATRSPREFQILDRLPKAPSSERWTLRPVGRLFAARQLALGMPTAVAPRRVPSPRPVAVAGAKRSRKK